MTKKEIVKRISEELGLTQLQTKQIVQMTFDAIIEALVSEGRIELRNFGVFEVKKRAARKARNPRSNASVFVPEKFVVTFKPGKEMEEQVRNLDALPEGAEDGSPSPSPNASSSPSQPVAPPSLEPRTPPANPSAPHVSGQNDHSSSQQPRYVPDDENDRNF